MNKEVDKLVSKVIESAQDRIDQIDKERKEYRLENVRSQRAWWNFIVTISFSLVSIVAAILSRDLFNVSNISIIGFFLLLGNGVLLSIKVKRVIEQETRDLQMWGLDEIDRSWKVKEAAWKLGEKPTQENYNTLVEASKPVAITSSLLKVERVDYSNDVAVSLLTVGLYLLLHDFILQLLEKSQSLYFAILGIIVLSLVLHAYFDGKRVKKQNLKLHNYKQSESEMGDRYASELEKKKVKD